MWFLGTLQTKSFEIKIFWIKKKKARSYLSSTLLLICSVKNTCILIWLEPVQWVRDSDNQLPIWFFRYCLHLTMQAPCATAGFTAVSGTTGMRGAQARNRRLNCLTLHTQVLPSPSSQLCALPLSACTATRCLLSFCKASTTPHRSVLSSSIISREALLFHQVSSYMCCRNVSLFLFFITLKSGCK